MKVFTCSRVHVCALFLFDHTQAVDPDNKRKDGDVVRYGDVLLLVDDRDYVWSDNVSKVNVAPTCIAAICTKFGCIYVSSFVLETRLTRLLF